MYNRIFNSNYEASRYPVYLLDLTKESTPKNGSQNDVRKVIGSPKPYDDNYVGILTYDSRFPLKKIEYNYKTDGQAALKELLSLSLTNDKQIVEYIKKYGLIETAFWEFMYLNSYVADDSVNKQDRGTVSIHSRNKKLNYSWQYDNKILIQPYYEVLDKILEIKTVSSLIDALHKENFEYTVSCLLILWRIYYEKEYIFWKEQVDNEEQKANLISIEDDLFYKMFKLIYLNKIKESKKTFVKFEFFRYIGIDYSNESVWLNQEFRDAISILPGKNRKNLNKYAREYALSIINENIRHAHIHLINSDSKYISSWFVPDLCCLLYYELYLSVSENMIWRKCAYERCHEVFEVPFDDTRKKYHDTACAGKAAQKAYRDRKKQRRSDYNGTNY